MFPLQQAIITPKITSTIKTFEVQRGSRVRKGAITGGAGKCRPFRRVRAEQRRIRTGSGGLYRDDWSEPCPNKYRKRSWTPHRRRPRSTHNRRCMTAARHCLIRAHCRGAIWTPLKWRWRKRAASISRRRSSLDDLQKIGREQALKSATGQLSAAKGKYLGAQAQLSYSEIRSPIDGVVTDRPLFPGELAAANQPLLTVMDTSKLIAKAHIAAARRRDLKRATRRKLNCPATKTLLKRASRSSVPRSIPAAPPSKFGWKRPSLIPRIRPGMTVTIAMTAQTVNDAIVVPAAALLKNAEDVLYVSSRRR